MGEFWMSQADGTMDCKEAASAAHVYGLPVVAAESFTGSGAGVYPAMMKPFADAALSLGINSFVVLASVHQPWDDRKPGVTEDRFYLPYQRHNTWWEYSGGFWNTLARSSYMMQQGKPVVDMLYHLGNETPLEIATSRMRPVPPAGYDYDVCGDEILLKACVKEGRICLPGGMRYRLLVLAGGKQLSLAAIRQIQNLVAQGATVVAVTKPDGPAGLADIADTPKFKAVAATLWGNGPMAASGRKRIGKGEMFWCQSVEQVLAAIQLSKDFEVESAAKTNILYAHRRTATSDIYFLANHTANPASFTGSFRVKSLTPQAWNPETGEVMALTNYRFQNDRTTLPLTLSPHGSLFIVFRKGSTTPAKVVETATKLTLYQNLSTDWQVAFEANRGAPPTATFPLLTSWSDNADSTIQQFSGTAVYTKTFTLNTVPKGKVILDIGKVAVVASIRLNGKEMGTVWKMPYALNVTSALQKGINKLEISVANLWTNRLIADAALPPERKIAWATFNPYKAGEPYVASGLLGPVLLRNDKL